MHARFDIPKKVVIKVLVFQGMEPSRLVHTYQRFDGVYCLHFQGSQKRSTSWTTSKINLLSLF